MVVDRNTMKIAMGHIMLFTARVVDMARKAPHAECNICEYNWNNYRPEMAEGHCYVWDVRPDDKCIFCEPLFEENRQRRE